MREVAEEILGHWMNNRPGYSSQILSIRDCENPAWAITFANGEYGVAVPSNSEMLIAERFSSVRLETMMITNLTRSENLVLCSREGTRAFAALCSEFVNPGADGAVRKALLDNPVAWWKEWKNLLGNKSVDKKVYDVLGELISLATLDAMGLYPIWTGPNGASVDIDCGNEKYEVKSSIVRTSKTIEAHGLFQLSEESVPKHLLFAQFEPSVQGCSIDGTVSYLERRSFSLSDLNSMLADLGYPEGSSSRRESYRLLGLSKYAITPEFPHISLESFVGGLLPQGVMGINYTVSLDGLDCDSLLRSVPNSLFG